MVQQIRPRMTAAEFWQLPETDQRLELIDGEVIEMATPVPDHQDVVLNTALVLKELNRTLGGRVYVAPLEVYLDEENLPQPDVMWVAANSRCVVGEKRLEGPPDLIVEVFSPGTTRHDKIKKFNLYQQHGVREYWMIDSHEQYVEVYRLEGEQFVLQGTYEPGQTFESVVLGGRAVDVKALFGG